jgi:ATP-binding cassette subfamily B protein
LKNLASLNKYILRYKWYLLIGILFVVASNYFRVLMPRTIREALDYVFDKIKQNDLLEGFGSQEIFQSEIARNLLYFGLLVILLALIMGIFMYFMRQTIIVMSRLIEYDLRKDIYAHYQELDQAFYKKNKTGDLMARITEDVSKVRMYLGPAILYGINTTSLFVLVIISMFQVDTKLSLYTLLPLPLLSISIYYVSNIINKKSTRIQQQLSTLNSIAQEVYSGIRVIKSYVQESQFAKYFGIQSEDYKTRSLELARVNSLFFPLILLLISVSTLLTIYIGGIQVSKGLISPGNLAEFVIYVNMLTWPVTGIGWIASLVQQAEASQTRINEFLDTKPTIENSDNLKHKLEGKVEFRGVDFIYPDTGIHALKNISFTIERGEKLGIIGKTASGKSTIAELILRMYDVESGQILIDDKPIETLDLFGLRDQIAYVPQDVFLFSDTIENNIAFGAKEHVPIAEIKKYAAYASVHNEIEELKNGYQTRVGERGVTLSGGQKQRVAMARAFINNPQIVILDDSLSAVDTTTEQTILSYLNEVLIGKTSIIITHRITGLLNFDKIIVIDEGEIAEVGTHESLLEKGGLYADLYEIQKVEDSQIKN